MSITALRDAARQSLATVIGTDNTARKQAEEALLKAGALRAQSSFCDFSSMPRTRRESPIFNVGAERMLGISAEVINKNTPATYPIRGDRRSCSALSIELRCHRAGFEASFQGVRGRDIYELTYFERRQPLSRRCQLRRYAMRGREHRYLLIGTD